LSPRRQRRAPNATGSSGPEAGGGRQAGRRERPTRREAERPGAQAGSRRRCSSEQRTSEPAPGETRLRPGTPQGGAGTSRRGNHDTGPSWNVTAVRRRGGPSGDFFGSRRRDRQSGRRTTSVVRTRRRRGAGSGSRDRTGRADGALSGAKRARPERWRSEQMGPSGAVCRRADREPSARDLAPRVPSGRTLVRPVGHVPGSAVFGPFDRKQPRGAGAEPQGREWMKDSTGSEEEQAARVVRNGGGGPKRVWEPATRHGGTERARARSGRPERASGETRRAVPGEHGVPGSGFLGLGASQGRAILREEGRSERTAVACRPGAPDRTADEVLEGECKARGGTQAGPETARPAARRKTPGSRSRGPRTEAEPRSQASGYGGSSDAGGQHNTAEGRGSTDLERDAGTRTGGNTGHASTERARHRDASARGPRYSARRTG
jgi:hypothetical protein